MEGDRKMKKLIRIVFFVTTALFLVLVTAGPAQESSAKMVQEIVKLKYTKSNELLSGGILYTFLSPQGRINSNPEAGLITISDFPENVKKILALIRELDVKPADIQFTIQLVLGSAVSDEKTDGSLEADPVIKELKSLLSYKSFGLLDTSFIRAIDGEVSEVTMGKDAELRLELRPKFVKEEKEALIQVEARLTRSGGIIQSGGNARRESTVLLTGNFTMKSGEKTVVGVSKMDGGEKGLILIISGKVTG
jgi:type II secretory pathway component GspD/PulD (secretin)